MWQVCKEAVRKSTFRYFGQDGESDDDESYDKSMMEVAALIGNMG